MLNELAYSLQRIKHINKNQLATPALEITIQLYSRLDHVKKINQWRLLVIRII